MLEECQHVYPVAWYSECEYDEEIAPESSIIAAGIVQCFLCRGGLCVQRYLEDDRIILHSLSQILSKFQ